MKAGYKKLLELLRQHGYNIESTGQDDELFVIVLISLYFTGSDLYYIKRYAEQSGVYFDGFYVEPDGTDLIVKLQLLDTKTEEAI